VERDILAVATDTILIVSRLTSLAVIYDGVNTATHHSSHQVKSDLALASDLDANGSIRRSGPRCGAAAGLQTTTCD